MKRLKEANQSIEEDCRSKVKVDLLNGKVKQIENIHEEFKKMLAEIKQDTPEVENLPPSMQKRRASLSGFIGSIIGLVIGVMTSDDAEEYDNAINELHDRQNNLSKILRKQTHIVKSEINNIHLEFNQKSRENYNTYNQQISMKFGYKQKKQNFQSEISELLKIPPPVSSRTLTNLRREDTDNYTNKVHQEVNKIERNLQYHSATPVIRLS